MEIKKGSKNFYVGEFEDEPLAEMTYVLTGEKLLIIDHTYVSEELKGQGVGKLLLKSVVDWAREEERKIVPLCPYAKAQMEKEKDYLDVLQVE